MITASAPLQQPRNYLNHEYGLKSWLLTSDHKRIAMLYLIVVTAFFFLGGFFAVLIRLELATPAGDLVDSNTYNKLFTMHGIIMVFFFLIPSIPAILGNFLIPLMIGAKDLAFPEDQSSELVYLHPRRRVHVVRAGRAAASTRAGRSIRRSAPPTRMATSSLPASACSSPGSRPSSPA